MKCAKRSDIGVQGITGHGSQGLWPPEGPHELYRGAEYVVDFLLRSRSRPPWTTTWRDRVIEAIEGAARTGKIGDGKIFVSHLEQVVHPAPAKPARKPL